MGFPQLQRLCWCVQRQSSEHSVLSSEVGFEMLFCTIVARTAHLGIPVLGCHGIPFRLRAEPLPYYTETRSFWRRSEYNWKWMQQSSWEEGSEVHTLLSGDTTLTPFQARSFESRSPTCPCPSLSTEVQHGTEAMRTCLR